MNKFKNFAKKAIKEMRYFFELGWKISLGIFVVSILFAIGLVVSTIGLIFVPAIIVGVLFVGLIVTLFEEGKYKL